MKKKLFKIVIALLVLGGGYYWYSSSQKTSAAAKYVTSKAQKGDISTAITASGNVSVDQIANIDPTISGTVADLAVKVGDSVKKGQFLFNIENDQLGVSVSKSSASLQQAQNAVDSAELSVKQAKADYDAAKDKDDDYTSKQLSVLKQKIDIAKLGVVAAQKSLAATAADFQSQKTDAGKRRVVAPIDGTVNAINIKNGDDLGKTSSGSSSTDTPIIIGDLSTLKVEVQVNEVDISNVKIGQQVDLTFDAISDLNATGKVEKIDSLGTVTSGVVTYNVTIAFDWLDERIKPEMSVSASIITNIKKDVVMIPNAAIKTQNEKSTVQVLIGQVPESRTVEIGVANSTMTEIASGIKTGENVVTQTIASDAVTTSSSTKSSTSTSTSSKTRTGGMGGPGGIPGL